MRQRVQNPFIRLMSAMVKTAGICAAAILLLSCIASFFRIRTLEIEPGGYYTEEEIADLFIKNSLDNLSYFLYYKDKLLGQDEIPFIQKAEITVLDRNTVHIKIYDKKITGCIDFMGSYLYFDKDGRVVESLDEHLHEIPVISGLLFDKIVLYETLEVQKSDLFQKILEITNTIQKYGLPVEEIEFQKNNAVVLYCDGHVVELGRQEYYGEKISELSAALESLRDGKYRIHMEYADGQGGFTASLMKGSD